MKKSILHRVTTFIIAVVILAGSSVSAIGEELRCASVGIGQGTRLARGVYYTYNRQTENYIEYTPNGTVTPVVVYGSKLCNYGNFDSMADLIEKQGYNVIGGINGDYYELNSYQPLGLVVSDGVLRSSDGGFWAIGFRADGTAFIDKPSLSMKMKIGTESYRLGGINKVRENGDYYMFTDDFSYTTKNTTPGRDVICSVVPDGSGNIPKLTMNCSLSLQVEQIVDSTGAIELPAGKIVLSLSESADTWRQYAIDNMVVGDTISIEMSTDAKWNDVSSAIGSYVKLVSNGAVDAVGAIAGTHPRTAIGIKGDGTLLLYTVDGRQNGYSSGFTPQETAQRLIELGCVDALLMDGGGSTNIHAMYIGDKDTSQINKPSQGSQRSVTNYIMLVAKSQGSGTMRNLGVSPYDALMLAGSTKSFIAGASDETSRAVEITGGITWSEANGLGSITQDGIFTAGKIPGNTTVIVSSGDLNAGASVSIIDTPSAITIIDESTGTKAESCKLVGGDILNFSATATYRYMDLICSDNAFTWSVTDGIGTIDENGLFTASTLDGSGKIMATAGDVTVSIDVTIKTDNEKLEDFEGDIIQADDVGTQNLAFSLESSKDYVKLGNKSLKLNYDLSAGSAYLSYPLSVDSSMNYISLWIYGDNSGNTLQAEFTGGILADIITLDFNGWRQAIVALPERGLDIKGMHIWGSGISTIWIDHIMASSSNDPDLTPPEIELSVNAGIISGKIVDAVNEYPLASRIELLYDGKPLEFNYNVKDGTLSAKLPVAEGETYVLSGLHKVTLRNWDKSGNVASKSVLLEEEVEMIFGDMTDHWSSNYVNYMYSRGVVTGMDTDQGKIYDPDSPITRAQFAVMISRWLDVDISLYAETQLSFSDIDTIPEYALDAVKAVCTMGIIKGVDKDGALYFSPSATLTRAQAMTVIGRIQRGGYPEIELGFTDAADVPEWALKYVRSLVSQNVISGFADNSLVPNGKLTRAQVAKILTEVT